MDVVSYSDICTRLNELMTRVVEGRRPVLVTRPQAEAVVIVSLADWIGTESTAHLLSTFANGKRLRRSIAQLDAEHGELHDLGPNDGR